MTLVDKLIDKLPKYRHDHLTDAVSGGFMVRRMATFAVAFLFVSAVHVGAGAAAFAACAPEHVKFLYRTGSGQAGYGNMGTFYSFNRGNSCGPVADTAFIRLGLTYNNFVETGLRSNEGESALGAFTEWGINGNVDLRSLHGLFSTDRWISFALTPVNGGAYWKSEYDPSGTSSSWTSLHTTPVLAYGYGLTESEVAKFGGDSGLANHKDLKYRPSTSGWFAWGSLGCDPNQQSMPNYDAIKVSNTQWYTTPGTPTAGDC